MENPFPDPRWTLGSWEQEETWQRACKRQKPPGHSRGTLPAQVGVPGPSLLLRLLQVSLLYANPETEHLELQARWAGHSKVFLFIPGFSGGEFCLKAPSMRGHPGKEWKTGNPHFTNRSFTLQKDPPAPAQDSLLCTNLVLPSINASFLKKDLFIYLWLCWVFVAVWGLSPAAVSKGYSSLWSIGFSLQWFLLLQSVGSRHVGSVVAAPRL